MMTGPSDPHRDRRYPPQAGPHAAASRGSADATMQARAWYEQPRRPLPPRGDQPPADPPSPPTMPASYQQQSPPRLQRPAYQARPQSPVHPPHRAVARYSYNAVPYPQVRYDHAPAFQYPVVPYPTTAQYAPPPDAKRSITGSTIALFVGGGIAVVVVAVVIGLGMVRIVSGGGNELDVREVEAGVKGVLTDPSYGYGVKNVANIRCNNGANPKVTRGAGFVCDVVVDGAARRVAVVFVDDQGTYEVDRPR